LKYLITILILFSGCLTIISQEYAEEGMNMDMLATFGNMSKTDIEPESFCQTIFFVIPENHQNSFYVRVFDPDCGGANDDSKGLWETNTEFEIYGGTGCIHLTTIDEEIKYVSSTGTLLQEELFAEEPTIDNSWVTFGPFTADQGEKLPAYSGRYFKLIVEGKTGNDCNKYGLFLSSSDEENEVLKGAFIYHDEFAFKADMKDRKQEISISAEPINL